MSFRHLMYFLSGLFLFHIAATYTKLYFLFPYIDMPVHFAGGLGVGLVFMWALKREGGGFSYVKIILPVMFVSFLWEYFSFLFDPFDAGSGFVSANGLSDLLFDFLGGSASFFYFKNR